MINTKMLEHNGFDETITDIPWLDTRKITYRKGFLMVVRREKRDPLTGRWVPMEQEVYITIPQGTPWDPRHKLEHIRNTSELEKLDKLLNV